MSMKEKTTKSLRFYVTLEVCMILFFLWHTLFLVIPFVNEQLPTFPSHYVNIFYVGEAAFIVFVVILLYDGVQMIRMKLKTRHITAR